MFFSSAQEEAIDWFPQVRLSWENFKGTPTTDKAAATTASGITYRFSSQSLGDEVQIDFTVIAQFYPNKSWNRPKLCDAHVLGHEQLHFDITEVFARKMRKRMAATKFTRDVKKEVAAIYDEVNVALYAFQHRYDNESNFSRNEEQQALWHQKIAKLLEND